MNESANHREHVGAISDAHRIGNLGCRGDVRATTLPIPASEGWFLRLSLKLKLTQIFLASIKTKVAIKKF